MNGVALAVHQSSSRIDRRKLVSITRSPSVAVVSEMAPRWMTASSRRPFSQSMQFRRRHDIGELALGQIAPFAVMAEQSQTTTSARPASFNAATTFDPIKPAPPVTSNMPIPALIVRRQLCPSPAGRQLGFIGVVKTRARFGRRLYLLARSGYRQGLQSTPRQARIKI